LINYQLALIHKEIAFKKIAQNQNNTKNVRLLQSK